MSTEPMPPVRTAPRGRPARPTGVLTALVAVLCAAAVAGLAACGGSDSGQAPTVKAGVPTIMSEADLRAFGRAQAIPVYWVGPRAKRQYELTRTSRGRFYVRYLPTSAKAGDPRPVFLTVGTYPGANAYGALQLVGRRPGAVKVNTRSGALVVYEKTRPSSVYFAFPNTNFQVEVYSPVPGQAKSLVLGGQAERLR